MKSFRRAAAAALVVLVLAAPSAADEDERPDPAAEIAAEVDALTADWFDRGIDERLRAIRRLGEIGPPAVRAIGLLYHSWARDELRPAAQEALERIDPEKEERVVYLLRFAWAIVGSWLDANDELLALGPRIVPRVVQALDEEPEKPRYAAIAILGRFREKAAAAIPALRRIHGDTDDPQRRWAARSVFLIAPETDGILPELIVARAADRWSFPDVPLGDLRRARPRLDEELARLLEDPRPDVRNTATDVLLEMRRLPGAVPALAALVRSGDGDASIHAAIALAKHAPWTAGVDAAIAGGIASEDEGLRVRALAAASLPGAGGTRTAHALAAAVRTGPREEREPAVRALGRVRLAPVAVPVLLEVLEGRHGRDLRYEAARSILTYGAKARDAIPLLDRIAGETATWHTCHGGITKTHTVHGLRWAREAASELRERVK